MACDSVAGDRGGTGERSVGVSRTLRGATWSAWVPLRTTGDGGWNSLGWGVRLSGMKHAVALVMVVMAMFGSGCGAEVLAEGPTTTLPPASGGNVAVWDESLTVRAGDVVRVPWSSLEVTVVEINDSRCPATPDNGIACVWEGNIVTRLRFVSDGGAVVERTLEGIVDGGQAVYGGSPSTTFDLVEVTAVGISEDGSVTLIFGGID